VPSEDQHGIYRRLTCYQLTGLHICDINNFIVSSFTNDHRKMSLSHVTPTIITLSCAAAMSHERGTCVGD
jgi:hypothetical protein